MVSIRSRQQSTAPRVAVPRSRRVSLVLSFRAARSVAISLGLQNADQWADIIGTSVQMLMLMPMVMLMLMPMPRVAVRVYQANETKAGQAANSLAHKSEIETFPLRRQTESVEEVCSRARGVGLDLRLPLVAAIAALVTLVALGLRLILGNLNSNSKPPAHDKNRPKFGWV